ncbi:MAG: caspase family protein [Hyphomicrobiaceae bacterium]
MSLPASRIAESGLHSLPAGTGDEVPNARSRGGGRRPPRLGWLAAAAFVSVWLVSLAPAPALAKGNLYGFVIGINDYLGTANDLAGAVNDAEDIAGALRAAHAKRVIKFIDQAGTKFNIERSFLKLVADAKAGDTILFSYSGHGTQEPEPPDRHGEVDGKNEVFLLSGYTTRGPGTKERILDDEIFLWLKQADDKGVNVVFVADSCHSGTMNRSVRSDAVRYRNADLGAITEDELDFPPPETATLTEADLKHVTFIGATTDDKLTPEVKIGGKWRGALSWSIARALEGRADRDANGEVDQFELIGYIVPAVASWVESQQTPQVVPLRPERVALFPVDADAASTLVLAANEAGQTGIIRETASDALKIAVEGGGPDGAEGVAFSEIVADKSEADLIWYKTEGKVEHRLGGEVASGVDENGIKPIISKFAALKWLKANAAFDPVNAGLKSGDKRYAPGEVIELAVDGAKQPFLTMFNMPPDGRVEYFYPSPSNPDEADKDWRNNALNERFKVDHPPYGAEHLVAIFTDRPLPELHAVLAAMKSAKDASGLQVVLEQVLAKHPFQVGVIDIYTGE